MGLISTLKHLVTYADSEERYWDIRCKAKAAPKLLRYWYLLQHRRRSVSATVLNLTHGLHLQDAPHRKAVFPETVWGSVNRGTENSWCC